MVSFNDMKKPAGRSISDESIYYACFKTLSVPLLRRAGIACTASIFFNFFFRQYRAALLPGRAPVTRVDHQLDAKIPFNPRLVGVYLDFVSFWVRMLSFLLRKFRRRAYAPVRDFLDSMGRLYAFAAEIYSENFSTTRRPFYIARPRFFLIHLADPHLMCVPSLHVMVVIRTYTKFRSMLRDMNEEERLPERIEELRRGSLAITEAVLYVKQHSVNCISAAMYAMTCFDRGLFPPEEAERFASDLFRGTGRPSGGDGERIREHILGLYRRFLDEGERAAYWTEPLLSFLRGLPAVTAVHSPRV
ncbi:MAG: hypothetical protein LBP27_06685 [Treponema sp.]|jgi:hypothetical protein|nr:hypothetical protein [Treponema sp.]